MIDHFFCFLFPQERRVDLWLKHLYENIVLQPIDCLKVSIPSFIYVIQNNLLYIAVSNLEAATFQVVVVCVFDCQFITDQRNHALCKAYTTGSSGLQSNWLAILMSPPVQNLRAVSLIPLFYLYILSCSSAQTCCSFCLILFCFWPIDSSDLFFPETSFFFERQALVCVFLFFFQRLGEEYFISWWYVQPMLPYGTGICLYAFMQYF